LNVLPQVLLTCSNTLIFPCISVADLQFAAETLLRVSKGILLVCSPPPLRGRVISAFPGVKRCGRSGRPEGLSSARRQWANQEVPGRVKPVICEVLSNQISKNTNDILSNFR